GGGGAGGEGAGVWRGWGGGGGGWGGGREGGGGAMGVMRGEVDRTGHQSSLSVGAGLGIVLGQIPLQLIVIAWRIFDRIKIKKRRRVALHRQYVEWLMIARDDREHAVERQEAGFWIGDRRDVGRRGFNRQR